MAAFDEFVVQIALDVGVRDGEAEAVVAETLWSRALLRQVRRCPACARVSAAFG